MTSKTVQFHAGTLRVASVQGGVNAESELQLGGELLYGW